LHDKLNQQQSISKQIDQDFLQKFELLASNQLAPTNIPAQDSIEKESMVSSEYTVIPIKQKSKTKNVSQK